MNIRDTEVLNPFLESPGLIHLIKSCKKLILQIFLVNIVFFKLNLAAEMEFKCPMFNLLFFYLTYHSLFNSVIFCGKNSEIFKYSLRFTIHSIVKKLLQFKFKLSLLLAHPVYMQVK